MESIRSVSIVVIAVILCIGITAYPVSAEEYPVVSRGESFNISVTLHTNDTSGVPLANQKVYFFDQTWNSLMASTETDSNGIASIDYSFPINHPLGNTLINITFRGNTTLALAPSCQWFTLLITSSTNIDIHVPVTEFAPYDNLEFSVHLVDDMTNPVVSANLTILCDRIPILDIHTNETGYISILIPLNPLNFRLGQHTIEVRYEGDITQFYRGSFAQFEFAINRIPTNFQILTISNNPVMLTQPWSTTLQVMTEEGHLTMETILILLDGTYLTTTSTDSEGYVIFSLLINQSFSIGEHTLTFEYLGNERYQQSLVDIVVNVGSSLYLNITPLNYAEIGKNLTLRINALDAFSRPLSDGTIVIIDSSTNQIVVAPLSSQSTTFIQFPIFGEKGPRTLHINVTNGILLNNNTITLNLNIWTRPAIEILSSNILGYSSPQQTLLIDIRLEDYRGALSDKLLLLILSSTNETTSVNTRIDGLARIEFQSPSAEGYYYLFILYEGNQSDYELSCSKEFSFIVSRTIPIEVILSEYEINSPLASIRVRLQIQALNGSYLEGIPLHYNWITIEGNSISTTDGITELHLPMPSVSGIHILHYEIETIEGLQANSGIIYIITTSEDANASQGVGFYGLFIGFLSSLGISLIPIVRRRLLVG